MKKTLFTAITAALIFSASAVVGGPKPDEGELAITSSGSTASGTTAVGPNSTSYSSTIEMAGRNPNISIEEEIENITYSENKVSFSSRIQAPTPCHVLEHKIEKVEEDSYRINVQTVKDQLDNQSVCAEQTLMIKYEGSFEAETPYTLEIRHNNQTVDTIEASDIAGPNPKDTREKTLVSRVMDWIGNLF